MKLLKLITVLAMLFSVQACSKKDSQNNPPTDKKVTQQDLLGGNGKRWPLLEVILTYYSSSNTVDSTVTVYPTSDISSIYFGDNNGVNGLNLTFDAQEPLNRFMPDFGEWTFDASTQKISLTCIPFTGSYCTISGGVWEIVYYRQDVLSNGIVQEFLRLQKTVDLPSGRKVTQLVKLIII